MKHHKTILTLILASLIAHCGGDGDVHPSKKRQPDSPNLRTLTEWDCAALRDENGKKAPKILSEDRSQCVDLPDVYKPLQGAFSYLGGEDPPVFELAGKTILQRTKKRTEGKVLLTEIDKGIFSIEGDKLIASFTYSSCSDKHPFEITFTVETIVPDSGSKRLYLDHVVSLSETKAVEFAEKTGCSQDDGEFKEGPVIQLNQI